MVNNAAPIFIPKKVPVADGMLKRFDEACIMFLPSAFKITRLVMRKSTLSDAGL